MKTSKSKIFTILVLVFFLTGTRVWSQESSDYGSIVKYDQAQVWIDNYDAQKTEEIRGHMYGSKALLKLLNQNGIQGVRIYNAMDNTGTRKLVFQGLGENATETGLAFDISKACPPGCGGGSFIIEDIGAPIAIEYAQELINNFSTEYPLSANSYTYSAKIITKVLQQKEAAGLFLAYGLEGFSKSQLIIFGISETGQLLIDGQIGANPVVGYSNMLSAQNK